VNTLPKPRNRATLHRLPGYHALRDHILDFLLTRSRTLAGTRPADWNPKAPPEVRPALLREEMPA
jgi:nitrate/nitrite transport system ATP-binding protein